MTDTCGRPSAFVRSAEGKQVQQTFYDELMAKLEAISPGISENI